MQNSDINKFKKIVGNKNVITDEKDMDKYLKEWRGIYTGVAGAIVKPKSTKEVSNIIKYSFIFLFILYPFYWCYNFYYIFRIIKEISKINGV